MSNKNVQHIQVKTTGAEKSKKAIKGVNNGLSNMAKKAGLAAAAYLGANALLSAVRQSIDLFGQQELAEKKLEAALGRTSDKLLAQARALQQVTTFGDEQIIEAQALIGSFVEEEDAIAAATKATLDLASAKGMELTVAADLVSKTLGSSTNALSRYGIEVVGAVGSTERLESLTNNLANVFGGQALAQTNTMTGAMQQMSNAIGDTQEDFGELLAPAVEKVAKFLKTAAENVGDFIKGFTETPLEATIRQLEDLGVAGEGLLRLKNLQIDADIRALNAEIASTNSEFTTLTQIEERSNELTKEASDLALELADINKNLSDEERERLEEELRLSQQTMIARGTSLDAINARKERQKEIEDELGISQQERLNAIDAEIASLPDVAENIAQLQVLEARRLEINNSIEKSKEGQIKKTQAQIDAEKKLQDEEKKKVEIKKIEGKFEDALQGKIVEKIGIVSKGNIKSATSDAYKMAEKAYLAFAEIPIVGPALGLVAASAAFAFGMKQVAGIKKAQYGADFVTDGPQMMMVGEGSGPERVQVTPLSDPNIDGPQGQGITLNINNPIMTESFVEDNVIPQIREGLRLGENIGL